jgi:hypothetical protein
MSISSKRNETPQHARRHLVRLSRSQRNNPNRPLAESFGWRRDEAISIIHEHIKACIANRDRYRVRQYGQCEYVA